MSLAEADVAASDDAHAAAVRRLSLEVGQLARQNRNAEAVPIWEELDRLVPGHPGIAEGRGAALVGAWRYRAAADYLAWANGRFPRRVNLLRLHGVALRRLGDTAQAVGALLMARELEPGNAEVHADLALALGAAGAVEDALPHARFAYGAAPDICHATVLAELLLDARQGDNALSVVNGAVVARVGQGGGELAHALLLRSFCLRALSREDEAQASALAALEAAPDNDNVQACVSMAMLTHGDFSPRAWSLYESRNSVVGIASWPAPERRWTGGDIAGKTLLVHAEQGFGDTIQFVRYLVPLAARGARVVLAVQPGLLRLLDGAPGADRVIAGGSTLPEFDLYVPLLSLPGLLGTTLQTVPPVVPLPAAPPPRPAASGGSFHVGLVWAGNRSFIDDRKRSLDPALLAPLADIDGVVLHSLNLGVADMPHPAIRHAMAGVRDFADTAAVVAGLDLVVSVDTAVAHLAATLGKPTWVLSRLGGCWRWLLERDDSPWYPTVRIYRQTEHARWSDVVDRLAVDLRRAAAAKLAGP